MLLAEQLLLLITSPEGKWLAAGDAVPLALAGALLAELAEQEALGVDDRGRIVVGDAAPPADPVLTRALTTFATAAGKKPKDVLGKVAKGLSDTLYERLIAAGIVEVHKVRLLPVRHYPVRDLARREQIRGEVAAAVRGTERPAARTGVLLGLIIASGALSGVLPADEFGLSKRELAQRARRVAEGDWASEAVGRAVREAQAATMAAITAATTAAVTSSGSSS